jgi:hypothetical protein
MKAGTENRNKTVAAGVLGACALIGVVYMGYTFFGGDSPTPPPTIVPVARTIGATNAALSEPASSASSSGSAGSRPAALPTGNAAGVAAKKMATSSASLDPTLDQGAMLRTEHLVYAGSGRNIFSAVYTPPVAIPKPIAPARKTGPAPPPAYVPPPGPPPPPPINLKFFGTATRANGVRQAFLLQGEDVFLASQGDIVARKYKIVSILTNSVQVEDLSNNNTQTLPLQSN